MKHADLRNAIYSRYTTSIYLRIPHMSIASLNELLSWGMSSEGIEKDTLHGRLNPLIIPAEADW